MSEEYEGVVCDECGYYDDGTYCHLSTNVTPDGGAFSPVPEWWCEGFKPKAIVAEEFKALRERAAALGGE